MSQQPANGTDDIGTLIAVSAETGETLWERRQRAGMLSVAASAGGLIFGGDTNGRFRAFDDETGEVLWETNLGAPVSGWTNSRSDPRTGLSRLRRTASSIVR
jgi:alcohol dehydrogenase (cytochrome c)